LSSHVTSRKGVTQVTEGTPEPRPGGRGAVSVTDDELRHRCEVRQLIRWRAERTKEWLGGFLDDIERRRGRAAAERLRIDIARQWSAGNRGAHGEWHGPACRDA
jgi:hypothetical protein